ncbi:hypothetical protein CQW23_14881 [Capsicum baccatum]|uniref:Uncharacterized protein n=1 Tax=Capsicum baccatum TaxID=33114 RepID=A0A2G2WKF2_CAPBA|nr:hypothetical protein CQW23_14881 [Capsicum baccatum]
MSTVHESGRSRGNKEVADPFTLVTNRMLSMPIDMPRTAYIQAIKGGKICEGCVGFEIKRVSCESLMDVEKMKYSWNAARESLRLTPPAQGSFKETITGFTYAVHLTRQNPKYFSDPEKFDPSRFKLEKEIPDEKIVFHASPVPVHDLSVRLLLAYLMFH